MQTIVIPSTEADSSPTQAATPTEAQPSQSRIRELNDQLRSTFTPGRVVLTRGVQTLDEVQRVAVLLAVRKYAVFTPRDDPYGEHDFGRVVTDGEGFFWKIDYYDINYRYLSPDPADETVTARVLTIMREDEC